MPHVAQHIENTGERTSGAGLPCCATAGGQIAVAHSPPMAWLVDNEEENFRDRAILPHQIECVLVGSEKPLLNSAAEADSRTAARWAHQMARCRFGGNKAAILALGLGPECGRHADSVYAAAMSEHEMTQLRAELQSASAGDAARKPSLLVYDWDGSISVAEGVLVDLPAGLVSFRRLAVKKGLVGPAAAAPPTAGCCAGGGGSAPDNLAATCTPCSRTAAGSPSGGGSGAGEGGQHIELRDLVNYYLGGQQRAAAFLATYRLAASLGIKQMVCTANRAVVSIHMLLQQLFEDDGQGLRIEPRDVRYLYDPQWEPQRPRQSARADDDGNEEENDDLDRDEDAKDDGEDEDEGGGMEQEMTKLRIIKSELLLIEVQLEVQRVVSLVQKHANTVRPRVGLAMNCSTAMATSGGPIGGGDIADEELDFLPPAMSPQAQLASSPRPPLSLMALRSAAMSPPLRAGQGGAAASSYNTGISAAASLGRTLSRVDSVSSNCSASGGEDALMSPVAGC